MRNYFIITFVFIGSLFACQQPADLQNIEKAISDLIQKYPQLTIGKTTQASYYKLVRSVKNENKKFQIQLFSAPDSIEDPQQIIIITNSQGQYYAIPFFSNTYRDFWNFQFDNPIPYLRLTNTTFEKELITALDTLNLNDTIGTGSVVIDEILFSLLHCRTVKESDSSSLNAIYLVDNYAIPNESFDSCFIRIEKNYKAISNEIHSKEYFYNYYAYEDEKNHRIYQFKNQEKRRRKKLNLSIKVYRQDCICHSFTM